MPNPILPAWEYIPDGEPRVFGDRVYLYGSHDRAAQSDFCDYKLKVWSAPLDDLNNWVCHGHSFHTRDDRDHKSDTEGMTDRKLFAPDVIEKDGRYYLYAYIVGSKGVVGVSDKPEGPFKLLSQYKYDPEDAGDDGIYNDAGVLVDDDGRVYIYYGFTESNFNEIDPADMYTIKKGSYKRAVIDDSDNAPGWKFSQWEMKGVPLRLEIGPKDLEKNQCVLVRRDTREKVFVSLDELETAIPAQLEALRKDLYQRALENREKRTWAATTMDEVKELAKANTGYIKTMWCGDLDCELKMKEEAGLSSRCMPFEQEHLSDVCPCCGKPAKTMVYWGIAY